MPHVPVWTSTVALVVAVMSSGIYNHISSIGVESANVTFTTETCFPFIENVNQTVCPTVSSSDNSSGSCSKLDCAPALPQCPIPLDCVTGDDKSKEISAEDSLKGVYCKCESGHPVSVRCPLIGWLPWEKTQMQFNASSDECVFS